MARKDYFNHFKDSWSCPNNVSIRKTIAQRPAIDATRKDLLIEHPNAKEIHEWLEDNKVKKELQKAIYFARNTGKGYILLRSGDKNESKIDNLVSTIDAVKEAALEGDLYTIKVVDKNGNKVDQKVHKSRVIMFEGDYDENGQAISSYKVVDDVINEYVQAVKSASNQLKKSTIPTFKISKLNEAMTDATQEGAEVVKGRSAEITEGLSNDNALFIDSEDGFEYTSASLSGTSELYTELRAMIAGATLPELILFDRPPSGLSSSPHEQLERYYGIVASIQETNCTPVYNKIFKYALAQYKDIEWQFAALYMPTDAELLDNKVKQTLVLQNIDIFLPTLTDEQKLALLKDADLVPNDFKLPAIEEFPDVTATQAAPVDPVV